MKMSAFPLFFSLLILGTACSKDNNTKGEFSFKANGKPYEFNGDMEGSKGANIIYNSLSSGTLFISQDLPDNFLKANLNTNVLELTTYHTYFEYRKDGIDADSSVKCLITITEMKNGRASGNFSGEVYLAGDHGTPIFITDGIFKHIRKY